MKTTDFDYTLPEQLIAQAPLEKRDHSRLMVVDRTKGIISHHHFYELPNLLDSSDVLVMNNTKVIKARLFVQRQTGAKVEIFMLNPVDDRTWKVMIKKSKRLQPGEHLIVASEITCELLEKDPEAGHCVVRFHGKMEVDDILDAFGHTPLPPYIGDSQSDAADQHEERYQTVIASQKGAVAAPTAGLHFTPDILENLAQKGIPTEEVTLHVGAGTFKPVMSENITDHHMHFERYSINEETAERLLNAKAQQRKIVAVGTTVTRTLESAYQNKTLLTGWQATNCFIYPGVPINFVDKLVTNFHLPKSSLIMLVSAIAGTELIREAYETAIKEDYRFYSFGDAMLIQ